MAGQPGVPSPDLVEGRRLMIEDLRHPAVDKVSFRYRNWQITGADLRRVADLMANGTIAFADPAGITSYAAYIAQLDTMVVVGRTMRTPGMGIAAHEGAHVMQDYRPVDGGWFRWNAEVIASIAEMQYVLTRWGRDALQPEGLRAAVTRLIDQRGLLRAGAPQTLSEPEVLSIVEHLRYSDAALSDGPLMDGVPACAQCTLYGPSLRELQRLRGSGAIPKRDLGREIPGL